MNILVVDIGGTNVKFLATGHDTPRKFPSGRGLTPERMVAGGAAATADWDYDAVSVGYPGPVLCGQPMTEPVNLGRGWMGFDFAAAFGKPVKVINDAALQALGSYQGGKMLFLGLGTGVRRGGDPRRRDGAAGGRPVPLPEADPGTLLREGRAEAAGPEEVAEARRGGGRPVRRRPEADRRGHRRRECQEAGPAAVGHPARGQRTRLRGGYRLWDPASGGRVPAAGVNGTGPNAGAVGSASPREAG